MIKIFKYLYIHWLFVLLMIFFYINRQLEILAISYLIMIIHEMAHLLSAKFLGLSISHIIIYPFGVNLRLKNSMLYSVSDEVILYLSGPLSNVIMALLVLPFYSNNCFFNDFYFKNIAYFIINMLPLAPLDGGMIIKKLLNYKFGFDKGNRIMRFLSFIFIILGVYGIVKLLYINEFNISICIFMVFIVGNFLVSKEKYNKTLMKELLYNQDKKNKKGINNAKIISADEKTNFIDIAKKFNISSYYFVFLTNEKRKVIKVLSEGEIIDEILSKK